MSQNILCILFEPFKNVKTFSYQASFGPGAKVLILVLNHLCNKRVGLIISKVTSNFLLVVL